MNIVTTYKTNANGTGQILARGGNRQKTVTFDPSRSSAANHGLAAGAFLQDKGAAAGVMASLQQIVAAIDAGLVEHRSNDSGTQHTFTV